MSEWHKEVSAVDRFFVAVNEVRPPFVIQLLLEGDGDPDPDALDEALERAAAVNPGCTLRLVEDEEEPRWVLGPVPSLTLIDAPDFDASSGEAAPCLLWPIDAKVGPTCELLKIRGQGGRSYLVFRALHAVMDGQGTLLWVKDVFRALRGEAPIGHSSTATVDQLIRDLNSPRRPYPKADALHPYGPGDPQAPGTFHWRRVKLDGPLDPLASGKMAVALAERARRGREGVVRINLPTDLRPLRPDERTTGNFFNSLFLEVPPGATVDGIALKIIQLLYKKEGTKSVGIYSADEIGSLSAFRVKTYWDFTHLHDTGLYAFSATLSHLGVVRGAELSAPGFAARGAFFVPLVGDSGCVVSINGFDQHTEVAVGLSARFAAGGQLAELAELVRRALS